MLRGQEHGIHLFPKINICTYEAVHPFRKRRRGLGNCLVYIVTILDIVGQMVLSLHWTPLAEWESTDTHERMGVAGFRGKLGFTATGGGQEQSLRLLILGTGVEWPLNFPWQWICLYLCSPIRQPLARPWLNDVVWLASWIFWPMGLLMCVHAHMCIWAILGVPSTLFF